MNQFVYIDLDRIEGSDIDVGIEIGQWLAEQGICPVSKQYFDQSEDYRVEVTPDQAVAIKMRFPTTTYENDRPIWVQKYPPESNPS